MRPVLICPDDLLEHMVAAAAFPGERPLYLVPRAGLRAYAQNYLEYKETYLQETAPPLPGPTTRA